MRRVACASVVMASLGARQAASDRYEATFTLRPIAALGRVTEDVSGRAPGAPVVASTYGGGGEVGLAYGLRNWLDVGAELVAAELTAATYASVSGWGRACRPPRRFATRARTAPSSSSPMA